MIKCVENYAMVKKAENGKLTAVASNARKDRDGEVILPSAFTQHLESYRANPVILASHAHRSFDGTPTIIGSADKIALQDDALVFEMTFAKTDLADQWRSLYENGHARAFSVGFIPMAGDWKEQDGDSVYVHTEVELLEISAVAVPANPDAVSRSVDEKILEKLIDTRINRALERLYAERIAALL